MDTTLRIDDELLERLGNYYASEYVTLNLPAIRQLPFHKWVQMELNKRVWKEGFAWSISA